MTTPFDRLPEPDAVAEVFGTEATAEEAYGLLTVDVPAAAWIDALRAARDTLGCTFFDWLSAVDEPGTGFRVCAHVAAPSVGSVRRLMIRTTVPHEAAALPTAVGVYAGAAWHERETYEMFGVDFTGHPHLVPLLLPEGFEGHPLRKDFVLAARVAKAWPGAKEPGESEHGGPKRRQMLPPGVPDPNDWGPLKGQLPPAPARPARTPRAAGAAGAAGAAADRPARRTRSVTEGSAGQAAAPGAAPAATPGVGAARRSRSASDGSASQAAAPDTPRKRTPDAPWDVPRDTSAAPQARPSAGATPPEKPADAQAAPAGSSPATGGQPPAAAEAPTAAQPEATERPEATAQPDPGRPPAGQPADGDGSAPAEGPDGEPARTADRDAPGTPTQTPDDDDAEGGSTP
ncbi:NADH-quinone oxidoreductase subunit C [Streptomyces sp. NPDC026673]|uniref:NADH-quinone oxidoreductase subunit C n=1 Tax=Streptomyces sp. NPDC026673 TaxID=3155724 RepID=UPI0033CDDEE0